MRPFTVCLFQESKILASATSGFGQKKKFTLRTAGAEGNVVLWIEKDVVSAEFSFLCWFLTALPFSLERA
jgi:hypothetical protein